MKYVVEEGKERVMEVDDNDFFREQMNPIIIISCIKLSSILATGLQTQVQTVSRSSFISLSTLSTP